MNTELPLKRVIGALADQLLLGLAGELVDGAAETNQPTSWTLADKISEVTEELRAISRGLDDEISIETPLLNQTTGAEELVRGAIHTLTSAAAVVESQDVEIAAEFRRLAVELESLCPLIDLIGCNCVLVEAGSADYAHVPLPNPVIPASLAARWESRS